MRESACSIEQELGQKGFTLIELMITVVIMVALTAVAIGSYSNMQRTNRVWAAAEELRGIMQASRLRALSTGSTQYVTVDIANDTIASTFWGGTYNSGTGRVTGLERGKEGVDWVDSKADGTAPSSPVTTWKTFSFTSRGTGSSKSIKAQGDGVDAGQIVITVNGTTGRVKYTEL